MHRHSYIVNWPVQVAYITLLYHIECVQKTEKQTNRETLIFPGFSLSLHPQAPPTNHTPSPPASNDVTLTGNDVITSASPLLRGVGLPVGTACPSHLEVVQLLDTSSIPLLWHSPLHLTLYHCSTCLERECVSEGGRESVCVREGEREGGSKL